MIEVSKKEIKERTFIPYEITIKVNNEYDHNSLKKELKELESFTYGKWYEIGRKWSFIRQLVSSITNHL